MKLAIVGSRNFTDVNLVIEHLIGLPGIDQFDTIVSGGAVGADSVAKYLAKEASCGYLEFLPEYTKYGKGAPFIRNKLIVDAADFVLAFWDGKSPGTKHTIEYTISCDKPHKIVYFNDSFDIEGFNA